MTYRYLLSGNPISFMECKNNRRSIWDDYHQNRLVHSFDLIRQHESLLGQPEAPKIVGPLHIDFLFVFKKHYHGPRRDVPPGTIDDLVKYIHHLAKDSVYCPHTVLSVTAAKKYGPLPFTEIIITPSTLRPRIRRDSEINKKNN